MNYKTNMSINLAYKLIANQFPQYAHLTITSVEKQGHDNYTYRLGNDMVIRIPTAECYALKIPIEQKILTKLASYVTVNIPVPITMGTSSKDFPYPFSIYKWLPGTSINLLTLNNNTLEKLALNLAIFLKELHSICDINGPLPGLHNWWRGDHISVYNKETQKQITKLANIIDTNKVINLWEQACNTKWHKPPVWIHGDFTIGNILLNNDNNLSAIIDFGGTALGDPACDLIIAWTYFKGKARDIFIQELDLDENTWTRAKAWTLWKATFELCQIKDKNSPEASIQKKVIEELIK